jgi:putative intracellular protease/amidase
MIKRILMVGTSVTRIESTSAPTGIWLEELAAAYFRFVDAGFAVAIVSIAGGAAPLDPMSLEAPWLSEAGQRFLTDEVAMSKLASTEPIADIDITQIDAVYLVGGAGAAWDFPTSAALAEVIEHSHEHGRVVAGVCHGVLGLTTARRPDGRSILEGRRVTGVSDAEERLVGFDEVVPMLPERAMRKLGATYSCADEPFGVHTVRDGLVLTGQNPASAAPLAEAIVEVLLR